MLPLWPLAGWAQAPMSLRDAVRLALDKNRSVEASVDARRAAESRVVEARGGRLPKVNYSEFWARSDNPVFVFSSLLAQHQFGEQNFQIGPLNRPDFQRMRATYIKYFDMKLYLKAKTPLGRLLVTRDLSWI